MVHSVRLRGVHPHQGARHYHSRPFRKSAGCGQDIRQRSSPFTFLCFIYFLPLAIFGEGDTILRDPTTSGGLRIASSLDSVDKIRMWRAGPAEIEMTAIKSVHHGKAVRFLMV